jgi:peptidoglycan/LPS O-acetylase OafA/YrhL
LGTYALGSAEIRKENPVATPSGYLRTLDGWRAVAVCAVVFYHSRLSSVAGFDLSGLREFCDHGVMLFFAISGILICSRLLDEGRLHGSVSLKSFYIRRLFRIQPAAVLYLAVAGILSLIGIIPQMLAPWLSSLLCFRNFYAAANWISSPNDRYTTHFWSLAVEEHFYLFLPLLLVIAKKRVAQVLGVLSVLFFLWPPIADHMGFSTTALSAWRTDMALRYLLVPAFMAVLLTRPAIRSWFIKVSSFGMLILLTVAGILISQMFLHGRGTNEICCIGLPLTLLGTMFHPGTWLGQLLESRLFTFMGKISYSLYLWHVLFFIRRPEPSSLRFLQSTPWNVIASIACAVLSYYLVEKPLIRIGHRLAPPATPGRSDLQRT